MRFQKRISLGKGLRLNLSKSGIGLSFGIFPGLSNTIGPRGAYSNLGIPGTGLSTRIPLGKTSNKSASTGSQSSKSHLSTIPDFSSVRINIGNDGNIEIQDDEGNPLDDSQLRKLKRTEFYKNKVKTLNKDLYTKIEGEKEKFIDLYKCTPKIIKESDWKDQINHFDNALADKQEFPETKPSEEECRQQLMEIAKQKIHSIIFWTNARKREEFVNQNFSACYAEKISGYNAKKLAFEKSESERLQKILDEKNMILEKILPGDKKYIQDAIEELLQQLSLPIDFSIDYQISLDNMVDIDIDLPEIEDLPNTKAQILKSGKVSVKNKTQLETKHDYATCVCGLAFYFAGFFFNISPTISKVVISGYTQRIDSKTGQEKDDYIYSIKMTRPQFEELVFSSLNPIEAFAPFEHQLALKSNFEMKTITPF